MLMIPISQEEDKKHHCSALTDADDTDDYRTKTDCLELRASCVGLRTGSFWAGVSAVITVLIALGLVFAQTKGTADARQDGRLDNLEKADVAVQQSLQRMDAKLDKIIDMHIIKEKGGER
jgi:hypothetical protein